MWELLKWIVIAEYISLQGRGGSYYISAVKYWMREHTLWCCSSLKPPWHVSTLLAEKFVAIVTHPTVETRLFILSPSISQTGSVEKWAPLKPQCRACSDPAENLCSLPGLVKNLQAAFNVFPQLGGGTKSSFLWLHLVSFQLDSGLCSFHLRGAIHPQILDLSIFQVSRRNLNYSAQRDKNRNLNKIFV